MVEDLLKAPEAPVMHVWIATLDIPQARYLEPVIIAMQTCDNSAPKIAKRGVWFQSAALE